MIRAVGPMVFKIADMVFEVTDRQIGLLGTANTQLHAFASLDQPEGFIRIHSDGLPNLGLQKRSCVLGAPGQWALYREASGYVCSLGPPDRQAEPLAIAVCDNKIRHIDLHLGRGATSGIAATALLGSYVRSLFHLLFSCRLSRGNGLMVHSCGIDDGGRGILFPGNSGDGKSTMARLWGGQGSVLNDDRVAIRRKDGRLRMYGTPWHGDHAKVSASVVPLSAICFLGQSARHEIRRLTPPTAASMLLQRSFLPIWDKPSVDFTLDFVFQVVSEIPCYELDFSPEESVVDIARSVLSA